MKRVVPIQDKKIVILKTNNAILLEMFEQIITYFVEAGQSTLAIKYKESEIITQISQLLSEIKLSTDKNWKNFKEFFLRERNLNKLKENLLELKQESLKVIKPKKKKEKISNEQFWQPTPLESQKNNLVKAPPPPHILEKTFINSESYRDKKFTLVLDLDETLMHYNARIFNPNKINLDNLLIRPYCQEFLERMKEYFEIIAFTVGVKEYAQRVMLKLDPQQNLFDAVLSREHAYQVAGAYIKNLDLLNRKLEYTLIIDNTSENFQKHKDNGIFIKSWFGDPNDTSLKEIADFLEHIIAIGFKDFKTILNKYRDYNIRQICKGKLMPLKVIRKQRSKAIQQN